MVEVTLTGERKANNVKQPESERAMQFIANNKWEKKRKNIKQNIGNVLKGPLMK